MLEEFAVMTRRIFKDLPISTQSEERVHHIAKARRHTFGALPSVAMAEALDAWRQERNAQQRDTISPLLKQQVDDMYAPGSAEFTYDGIPIKIT
jgi:hypothetical protein